MISWDDFSKIDIHVGTIIQVDNFPQARKPAYKLTIDFGELGVKKSSAQLTKLYIPQNLLGRQIIAVTNFPPKQIANFFSECLVLGIIGLDKEIILLHPERQVMNGMKIG